MNVCERAYVRACVRACVCMYVQCVCLCCACVCACVHVFSFKLHKCRLRQMVTPVLKLKKLFWLIILTEATFPTTTSLSTLKIGAGAAPTGR